MDATLALLMPIALLWSVEGSAAQPQDTRPPRFPVHSLNLTVRYEGEFEGVIEIHNVAGPDIMLWDHRSGFGDYAYRLEFINPMSATHYVIIRTPPARTMNVSKKTVIRKGETLDIGFDLKDGSWIIPQGFPDKLTGLRLRAWYKPGTIDGEKERASQIGVTLDCFVGEFCEWGKSQEESEK